jgi:hypothetical protein
MLHANIYISFKFLVGSFSRKIYIYPTMAFASKSMSFGHAIGPSQNMNISSIFSGIKR